MTEDDGRIMIMINLQIPMQQLHIQHLHYLNNRANDEIRGDKIKSFYTRSGQFSRIEFISKTKIYETNV